MYTATTWNDDIYDAETGELIQEGTPVDAERLNKMEQGIVQAHNMLESGTVTLTNSGEYPFNDSNAAIKLSIERPLLNYLVNFEIVEADGPMKEIIVVNRTKTAFGVRFTGSAKNVTLQYFVTGGF